MLRVEKFEPVNCEGYVADLIYDVKQKEGAKRKSVNAVESRNSRTLMLSVRSESCRVFGFKSSIVVGDECTVHKGFFESRLL